MVLYIYIYILLSCRLGINQISSCLICLESSENYYVTMFVNFAGILYQSIRLVPNEGKGAWFGGWTTNCLLYVYFIYFMYVRSKKNQFMQHHKTKIVIHDLIFENEHIYILYIDHEELEIYDELPI